MPKLSNSDTFAKVSANETGRLKDKGWRVCDQRHGGPLGPAWPRRESKVARGKVFIVGVDSSEQTVQHRLKLTNGLGHLHFPLTVERPFFEQLNSEYFRTVDKHGRPERTLERRKGRAAEARGSARCMPMLPCRARLTRHSR